MINLRFSFSSHLCVLQLPFCSFLRVEQVISKVRDLSHTVGANPDVTEQVYRAMIAAFIQQELAEHAALAGVDRSSA